MKVVNFQSKNVNTLGFAWAFGDEHLNLHQYLWQVSQSDRKWVI